MGRAKTLKNAEKLSRSSSVSSSKSMDRAEFLDPLQPTSIILDPLSCAVSTELDPLSKMAAQITLTPGKTTAVRTTFKHIFFDVNAIELFCRIPSRCREKGLTKHLKNGQSSVLQS